MEPSANEDGAFERTETSFREWVRDDLDARFRPEAGRYHLYVARNCPWAHGAALVRRLAGLTDAVSMDVVDPWREDEGWEFTPAKDGCTPDTVNGCSFLRDVYRAADPEYTGRVTVPVLWDRQEETIVNNESIEIMRMFATAFRGVGQQPTAEAVGLSVDSRVSRSTVESPTRPRFLTRGFLRRLSHWESEGLVQRPRLQGRLTDCPSHRPLLGL